MLGAAALVAVALAVWFGAHQGDGSSRPPAADSEELALGAFKSVLNSPDPFATGAELKHDLLSAPHPVLEAAQRAWGRREFGPVCAVVSALGKAATPAIPWLAPQEGEIDSEAEAASTVARWYIDGMPSGPSTDFSMSPVSLEGTANSPSGPPSASFMKGAWMSSATC